MNRIIAVSDIHGFYDELMEALDKVNFNKNTDLLICCGDAMDRGDKPRQVIEFLNNLPNKILVAGNHESLMQEAIERKYFLSHDISNGTAYSAYDFCLKENAGVMNHAQILGELRDDPEYKKYINSLVDYFETKNYIFVHAWIPVNIKDGLPKYYTRGRNFEYNPEWRYAHALDWEDCKWMNPFETASQGLNQTGKIIVHGHWHNSAHWAKINHTPEFSKDACFDICEHDNCIGVDACTAYTHKCNVLVLEDEFLEE